MDGVTTTTSMNDVHLCEPQFDPWLEELNRRSATFFIHPTITKAEETLLNGLNASVIEFMFNDSRDHQHGRHRRRETLLTNQDHLRPRRWFTFASTAFANGGQAGHRQTLVSPHATLGVPDAI
jgi:hypothetical protein